MVEDYLVDPIYEELRREKIKKYFNITSTKGAKKKEYQRNET